MLDVIKPDWEIINEYKDGGHDVIVEGVYEFRDSINAKLYQVVFKNPWRTLIKPTDRMPNSNEIHSAISLITHPPAYVYVNVKLNLLKGLFLRLNSMSKQKGFCIVCGRTGADFSAAHDGDCVLYKALVIIQR